MSQTRVELVPWDPESPEHVARMVDQRIECGWHEDKVPEWQGHQRSGLKCIYWIALHNEDPERDAKLAKHVARFTKEAEPLTDTAASIRAVPRTPAGTPFHPVGHISLDIENPMAKSLNLPIPAEHVYWIKSLYVSFALQSSGIGRAAMDLVEDMATKEPLCATTLILDTISKEDQLRKESAAMAGGKLPPMSTHEWYERRGYEHIWTEQNFYGFPDLDLEGRPLVRRTVFLRRDLV